MRQPRIYLVTHLTIFARRLAATIYSTHRIGRVITNHTIVTLASRCRNWSWRKSCC